MNLSSNHEHILCLQSLVIILPQGNADCI